MTLRLGLLQTTTGIDPAVNAERIGAGLDDLAAAGATLAFTPEMSGLLDRDRDRLMRTVRDEATDTTLAAARAAAERHQLWVHLGSLALRDLAAGDRLVNRGFLIDDRGAIRARYDKIHLFDVDLPTGERYRESATYAAGTRAVAADTPWGRLGLSICYDLRFPGLYAGLAEAGAAILSVPAAFTRPTGEAHWHTLLRARAIEAAAFVVAAAQTGRHADGRDADGRDTDGRSLVVDPWGAVLLDMGEAEGMATCDIDLAAVAETRARIPALASRRPVPVEVAA